MWINSIGQFHMFVIYVFIVIAIIYNMYIIQTDFFLLGIYATFHINIFNCIIYCNVSKEKKYPVYIEHKMKCTIHI